MAAEAAASAPKEFRWYVVRVASNREERVRDNLLARVKAAGWRGSPARTATLSWMPDQSHHGIDQGYDLIAAHAVDLVIAQLQRNERGLPADPRVLLSPGIWIEAEPSP